jgi:DNA-binding winged helix-turn-helix (wHTH) protein
MLDALFSFGASRRQDCRSLLIPLPVHQQISRRHDQVKKNYKHRQSNRKTAERGVHAFHHPSKIDPDVLRSFVSVTLPPKDLETLLVLVERAGHIVNKEEPLERLWPGVFIEEGNLARHIFNLQKVMGDSLDGRKYIETIPRSSYRFVTAVHENGDSATPPQFNSRSDRRTYSAMLFRYAGITENGLQLEEFLQASLAPFPAVA